MSYPAQTGLGQIPVVGGAIEVGSSIISHLPVIGGLFKSGMCAPTMPGTVGSLCRSESKHFILVPSGSGGQIEMWHTGETPAQGSTATPRFKRMLKDGESKWAGFHDDGVGWRSWESVPQIVRDYWTSIRTTGAPPRDTEVDHGPSTETTVQPATMGMALPVMALAALMLLSKK